MQKEPRHSRVWRARSSTLVPALLVSHWAVASDATVKLITGAMERMASCNGVGRAEAMRQSMLAQIDEGTDYEAHPAFWAPFVVVGEGAAR
jgi:CHAT domain-containing protein